MRKKLFCVENLTILPDLTVMFEPHGHEDSEYVFNQISAMSENEMAMVNV